MSGNGSLAEVRSCIDAIDGDLVDLLARRQALVQRAARFKAGQDAVRAPERVAAIIEAIRLRAADKGLAPDVAEAIWRAMITALIEVELAEHRAGPSAQVRIRLAGPGDVGWMVYRHGVLYTAEYGFGSGFEALVAGIAAAYLRGDDSQTEGAWIAELDGRPVGSVLCVRHSERTAALRLLLLEPDARGLGIGSRLVAECITFARQAGYHHLVLTTADILVRARRTYQQAGFELTSQLRRHHDFGPGLTEEEWSLQLRPSTTEGTRGPIEDTDARALRQ
jgi:chorismate mutase/ribosomal protein S18 acetylase RimI-like enzyme